MALGRDHDRATLVACIPFGLSLTPWLGLEAGLLGAGSFLVGGLWLSPDLDTHSKPLHRWGALRWIWWPYRRLIPHRSLLSHGPLIGMALRLLWLLSCSLLGWLLLRMLLQALLGLSLTSPSELTETLLANALSRPPLVLSMALGLETSVWLHLLMDGDPLPVEWRRWRRRKGHRQ